MIYEHFVRKSFIRSSVYKIHIIFAISFIHTEYKHANRHGTEYAWRWNGGTHARTATFFARGIYIFSAHEDSVLLEESEKIHFIRNSQFTMNTIVMSSERVSLQRIEDSDLPLFEFVVIEWLTCLPYLRTKLT